MGRLSTVSTIATVAVAVQVVVQIVARLLTVAPSQSHDGFTNSLVARGRFLRLHLHDVELLGAV